MKSKKKKLNIRKFLFTILIIVLVGFVIKLGVKNIIKTNTTNSEENLNTQEAISVTEEENQEEDLKAVSVNETSSKQKSIKEAKLSAGKTLSADGLPVLMYHFFYDKSKGETGEDRKLDRNFKF